MAAGLGFIEFTTGDVLSASAANGYLASQSVMVFATAAARTTAITSPQQGMISFLKDTNTTQFYTGAAWTNLDTAASPLTTKGDIYGFSTVNARLAVGANNTVLTADSAQATGLKWAAPVGAGALTLLTNTPFSAVASISIPASSFSATYDDYLILLNTTTSSANQYIQGRLRAAGTDNTTSNYSSGFVVQSLTASTITNDFGGVQNAFTKLAYAYSGAPGYYQLFIKSPFATRLTSYNGQSSGFAPETHILGGFFNATTSFDAMTFIVGGTITGSVAVYGISK